jgi:L-iditol 2-dehydrogenase
MKTTSAQICAPWQTRLVDVELPQQPPAGFVLLDVDACGVCGTDLTAAMRDEKWHAFGHEVAGAVRAVGETVRGLEVGQKVVLESSSYCGTCELCRAGRVDLCNRGPNFWSQPALGFSHQMLTPACACVAYDGMEPAVACLAEPAGVALDMVKTAGIQLGDRVAVLGIGPIGLIALALARHSGAAEVTAIAHGHSQARIRLAEELGARIVRTRPGEPLDPKTIGQFDHILCTAPVDVLPQALNLLRYGGILTYVGIGTGNPQITFDANTFHFRKLQLRASFASPAIYYPQVLRLLQTGIIPGPKLLSHRFPLADIQKAMETCRDDKAGSLKVVITPR